MEKANRIAQMYGYVVCIIAVVTFLIASNKVVDNLFDLSNPEAAQDRYGLSSARSFEAYKLQYSERTTRPSRYPDAPAAELPPDSTLRRMYQEERDANIQGTRYRATRSLVSSGLLLLLSLALFFTHWTWLRRLARTEP